ncbi:M50 family metallopeptidase [Paenibacillus thalictri]|uniref:M50 family peptidase n=1 Tax=Paenibacillus thalictri TaxID=2527873 RepID=A0A4Q9DGY6_9BACL|nr:M50 family metallopeptidase [Paenibacillus thalictri]TBL69840.1 M50 family peptidase [Paenibacillus thalictri]
MSNWLKTILFLLGSAFLTHFIPFSSFFRNLDTMVHEFGHAVVTLALSGKVMYIELYGDHSGVTYSSVSSSWSLIPISLAGYMTASLFAVFLFHSYAKGKQRLGLQIMTLIALISLILFVRNQFGMLWLIGFIILNVLVLAFGAKWIRNFYYLLLSFLTLEESVFGALSLVLYASTNPAKAGDASNLSRMTGIPSIAWAVLFSLFALWCAKLAIQAFAGTRKTQSSQGARG